MTPRGAVKHESDSMTDWNDWEPIADPDRPYEIGIRFRDAFPQWEIHVWLTGTEWTVLTEIRITPTRQDTQGLIHPSARQLEELAPTLNLFDLKARAMQAAAEALRTGAVANEYVWLAELRDYASTASEAFRRARYDRTDDRFLAELAARYVALSIEKRAVKADLAKEFGRALYTIRDLLTIARNRGLLEGGSKGRAGGKLTDKAKRLLAGEDL